MKIKIAFILALMTPGLSALAQGTAFTYQGHLNDGANSANGAYDLRFALFDAVSAGVQQGGTLTNSPTSVSNGVFTVTLDFGNQFPGAARWLEIAVRTNNGASFTVLSPRQRLTATPYAITASNLTGVVGTSSLSGTYSSAITFNNAANSFSGNGANLTSLNAGQLTTGQVPVAALSNAWRITGNTGANPTNGFFLGTTDNLPLEFRVNGRRGLRLQPNTNAAPTVIAGSVSNSVSPTSVGAVIGGGDQNLIQSYPAAGSDYATISGGSSNLIDYFSFNAAIAGGFQNTVGPNSYYSIIGGGLQNRMDYGAAYSAIFSGRSNALDVFAQYSFIGGGEANSIGYLGFYSAVGGGKNNLIRSNAQYAVIGGGRDNTIQTNGQYSTIGGGQNNRVERDAWNASIGGGGGNSIQSQSSTIAGGSGNIIETNAYESTIGGGYGNTIRVDANRATIAGGSFHEVLRGANNAFVGGGTRNKVSTNSDHSTISAGSNNTIERDAGHATISGGQLNTIGPAASAAVIGGGDGNQVATVSGTVAGGTLNTIETNSVYATIGGGGGNRIRTNSNSSTISGGYSNLVLGSLSTIAGGYQNSIANEGATVGGGSLNTANGFYGTVPGGALNAATAAYTFAGGYRAKAIHQGAFVWADTQLTDFASTALNQVNFRCAGGVRFNSGTGGVNQQVAWTPGSASWSFTSDRNTKDRLKSVDTQEVLEKVTRVPIHEWNYIGYEQRHIGPMAQDFHAQFPFNNDDKSLNDADLHGVTLAAIQGLNQKLEQKLEQKETEITELKQRLAALEKIILNQR